MAATDQARIDRFCELTALGLGTEEAARAAQISKSTGGRLLGRTEIRKKIEELKAAAADDGMLQDINDVIKDLLIAVDSSGNANMSQRQKGVELALKYGDRLDELADGPDPDELPEGVWRVYPLPKS